MKKIIKQEQWVMLPTNESPISLNNNGNLYFIGTIKEDYIKSEHHQPQHLYLTSDDDIKEGDWIIKDDKVYSNHKMTFTGVDFTGCKKIIATTDKKLVVFEKVEIPHLLERHTLEMDLPQIPESFIKYYVEKQGEVGDVELELEKDNYYYNARVIIPKEEEKM